MRISDWSSDVCSSDLPHPWAGRAPNRCGGTSRDRRFHPGRDDDSLAELEVRFGRVSLEEAEGAILAHSLSIPGRRLPKGRVLDCDDLAAVRHAGLEALTVARLDRKSTRLNSSH